MSVFFIVVTIFIVVAGYFYIQLGKAATPVRGPAPKRPAGAAAEPTVAPASDNGASSSGKQVLVLFGSQTGTAEMFAKTVTREGAKLGVPIRIDDVENFAASGLEDEQLVILVCATYGEGEPTDTMKNFHDYIMDDSREPGEELRKLKYTVFGLGDRQYKYFCEEAIEMDRRFDELGAERIYGMHCGDSGAGQLEEEFDEWRSKLWPAVGRALGITIKSNTEEPVEAECRMKIWEEKEAPLPFPKTASVLEPTQRLPVWVPLNKTEELLKPPTETSTLELEFGIGETIISYQAGDHLGILPCNPDALVDEYLKILKVSDAEAAQVFSLQDKKTLKNVFPARVSVRTALKWYMDLSGPAKKSTLRAFAHCCKDPVQKEELLRILRVNPEAQKEFTKLSHKLRNMFGFLRKYDSADVPLSFFLELMPRVAPRYYSVSSDLLSTPSSIGITAAIVEGGLCTGMLKDIKVGERIPVFVRKSNFHLPLRDKTRPVVMIGPGTGVAPFIGFIHRRTAWQQKKAELGKALLFFGCRHHAEDHIYEAFCEEALHNGVLSTLDVAYSRDQAEKVYVQHRLKARAKEVWDVIESKGNIYVCGDAKHMAKDVEAVLLSIIEENGGVSADNAKAILKDMETEERYLKDVWSASL